MALLRRHQLLQRLSPRLRLCFSSTAPETLECDPKSTAKAPPPASSSGGVNLSGIRSDGKTPRWYKTVSVEDVTDVPPEYFVTGSKTKLKSSAIDVGSSHRTRLRALGRFATGKDTLMAAKQREASIENTSRQGTLRKGKFALVLDDRYLRTPANHRFCLPTLPLAHLIGLEWASQDHRVRPHLMPLTHIAVIALDQAPGMRHTMVGQCLQHLLSDSVCFRADGKLGHRQRKLHDPLIDWFQNRFNCPLQVFSGFSVQEQHDDTVNILRWHLHSLDDWTLAAVETLCRTNKSIVVALAVADGQLTAEEALAACRTEEEHQISIYGEVEDGHDTDKAYLNMMTSAAALFVHLLPPSFPDAST